MKHLLVINKDWDDGELMAEEYLLFSVPDNFTFSREIFEVFLKETYDNIRRIQNRFIIKELYEGEICSWEVNYREIFSYNTEIRALFIDWLKNIDVHLIPFIELRDMEEIDG